MRGRDNSITSKPQIIFEIPSTMLIDSIPFYPIEEGYFQSFSKELKLEEMYENQLLFVMFFVKLFDFFFCWNFTVFPYVDDIF